MNIGLLDQTLALKWIHENIDLFGGDRERITILGSGKGNFASFHLLSPESCQLYNNMIIQSGYSLDNFVTMDKASFT